MDLHSPHNDEQCICSSADQLENRSLKDCAFMYKQLSTDLENMNKYLSASFKEAIAETLKYRDARTAKDVELVLQRFLKDYAAQVQELCSDVDDVIVTCDQEKCPYCK